MQQCIRTEQRLYDLDQMNTAPASWPLSAVNDGVSHAIQSDGFKTESGRIWVQVNTLSAVSQSAKSVDHLVTGAQHIGSRAIGMRRVSDGKVAEKATV